MAVKGNQEKNLPKTQKIWLRLLSVAIIAITTLSLYHRSVKNDFLDLDDMTIIVRNYDFLKDFSNAGQVFKQGAFQVQGENDTLTSYYRPMMILSFMTDAHICPKKSEFPTPKSFIKANIFYHTIACILLFYMLLELGISITPALLLTLIFTVHPLLNQAVVWIPGRNDSLLTIFILSSFICLFRYFKRKKNILLLFHFLFFLMALFTKENAVMFVPVAFLFIYFINKEKLSAKTYFQFTAGYLLCIIPWFIMRHIALTTNAYRSTLTSISTTLFSNVPFYIQYISKCILPFNLSVMSIAADTNYLTGAIAIALLLSGIFLSKKKNTSFILFGLCWFLLFLTPSFFSNFSGLEHRAYLPLIGILITASQFDIIKSAGIENKTGLAVLMGIVLLFFTLSYNRLPIFHDRFSFNKSAMNASQKSALPCLYLAQHYEQIGDYSNAINAYREGLKRDSTVFKLARVNIAGDYIRMKMFPEAEKELRTELKYHPESSIATFNLGLVVYQGDHNIEEAVTLWKKSLSLDSNFVQPYKVLSQYYTATGDSTNAPFYRTLYLKKLK